MYTFQIFGEDKHTDKQRKQGEKVYNQKKQIVQKLTSQEKPLTMTIKLNT